jgi:hypothetical protein
MTDTTPDQVSQSPRKSPLDSTGAMWAGVAFCLGYVVLIYLLKPFMPQIDFAPDTGFAHYYWKLTDPTFWSRATAWGGYILHQVTIWGLIYYAQEKKLSYTKGLHPVNIWAMGANAAFVMFHLLQTHIWYDGTAQDTHIMTSQGSVILLLVMVLIMENQRRGILFGKKVGWLAEPGRAMRKYHGYIFSWAVIYTFWYHPMETTIGHLMGTFYTTMIMLQGSLMFTRTHTNKYWTFTMEFFVVVHGTIVALMHGNGQWGQFLFGFLAMFIITQMHGLGLSKWLRWAFLAAYIGAIALVYVAGVGRGMENIAEVPRVPAVEYALVFMIGAIVWLGIWMIAKLSGTDRANA